MVQAGVLDDVRRSGVLKVAFRADAPPFSTISSAGIAQGYSIDLCLAIASDLQKQLALDPLKVEFVRVKAAERIDAIESGQAHLECGNTTVTFSRLERVDFSNLFYMTGGTLLTRADTGIGSAADLDGRKVGVVRGTTTEQALARHLDETGVDASIERVGTHDTGLSALLARRVDAIAGDRDLLTGLAMNSDARNDLRLTSDLFSYEPCALPLPRNDADFRLAVNRSLARVYQSGEVGRIWEKWFGSMNLQPTRELLMLYRLNSPPE
jgi:ABC-type amino acid transport substrate-binding protein